MNASGAGYGPGGKRVYSLIAGDAWKVRRPGKSERSVPVFMSRKKQEEPVNPSRLGPEERLKYEIAEELGLSAKVMEQGWKSLTSKESGRIGGLVTRRKREMKEAARFDKPEEGM